MKDFQENEQMQLSNSSKIKLMVTHLLFHKITLNALLLEHIKLVNINGIMIYIQDVIYMKHIFFLLTFK